MGEKKKAVNPPIIVPNKRPKPNFEDGLVSDIRNIKLLTSFNIAYVTCNTQHVIRKKCKLQIQIQLNTCHPESSESEDEGSSPSILLRVNSACLRFFVCKLSHSE